MKYHLTCDLCHKEFVISKFDMRYIQRYIVSNIPICQECIKYYELHKTIHSYICRTCGNEFMMTKGMIKNRGLLNSIFGLSDCECKKCHKKTSIEKTKNTCIEKYGVDNVSKVPEVKSKIKSTFIEHYGVDNPSKVPDIIDKIHDTFERNYGVRHVFQVPEIKQKCEQTMLNRYGVKNPGQSPTLRNKIKQTMLMKYGVEYPQQYLPIREKTLKTNNLRYGGNSPMCSNATKNKSKITCIKKYGVPYSLQSPVVRRQSIDTLMHKYGVTNAAFIPGIQERTKRTMLDRYGVEHALQSPEFKNEFTKTMIHKHGVEHALQSPEFKNEFTKTMIHKHGAEHALQSPEIRSKQAKSARVSKLEKRVIEMLTNRKIEFQHQYVVRQNGTNHAFDFAIFRHGKLVALVDVDGLYYHGYLDESNQTQEYDSRRTLCVPEGVKFIVIFENQLEQGFRELLFALSVDYDSYLKKIFNWCRSIGFPDYKYTKQELWKSYDSLCNYDTFRKLSKIGERIVRHFHPSILRSNRVDCSSPYDGYMNDELLMKVIKNRFIYANSMEPARILEGFNISKVAPKVSVFSPSLAKTLVQKYLSEYETVFDPFSGFSGRMLGTCSLGKKYIGQDINHEAVKESNQIIEFFSLSAEVSRKDILESSGEYPCLFTCSPYSNKEIWGTETEFLTCDEWIDECLTRFKCSAYLFVVDSTSKYKDYIVEELTNKSHFGKNTEKVVLIQKEVL